MIPVGCCKSTLEQEPGPRGREPGPLTTSAQCFHPSSEQQPQNETGAFLFRDDCDSQYRGLFGATNGQMSPFLVQEMPQQTEITLGNILDFLEQTHYVNSDITDMLKSKLSK